MISFNYISANERSTFNDSITVAADPEGTYCYIGYNTTNKILSSTLNKKPDFNYDAFIIVEGDANNSPLLITHGKVIELTGGSNYETIMNALNNKADASVVDAISGRVLSLESNPRIFITSDKNNLPSDLKDGDLVGVLTWSKDRVNTLSYDVTNLTDGVPDFNPTNGQYIITTAENSFEHFDSGYLLVETYNPIVKVYLCVDEEEFYEMPQSDYKINADGTIEFDAAPYDYAQAHSYSMQYDAEYRILMEKTEPLNTTEMKVYVNSPHIQLYTYIARTHELVSKEEELSTEVSRLSGLIKPYQIVDAVIPTIGKLEVYTQEEYDNGTLLLLNVRAANSPQDLTEVTTISYKQNGSKVVKTLTEITDSNGMELVHGQWGLQIDSQDTTRRPYILVLYKVGTTTLRTLEANSIAGAVAEAIAGIQSQLQQSGRVFFAHDEEERDDLDAQEQDLVVIRQPVTVSQAKDESRTIPIAGDGLWGASVNKVWTSSNPKTRKQTLEIAENGTHHIFPLDPLDLTTYDLMSGYDLFFHAEMPIDSVWEAVEEVETVGEEGKEYTITAGISNITKISASFNDDKTEGWIKAERVRDAYRTGRRFFLCFKEEDVANAPGEDDGYFKLGHRDDITVEQFQDGDWYELFRNYKDGYILRSGNIIETLDCLGERVSVQDFNALATRVTKIEPIQAGDVRQPTGAEVHDYGLSSNEYVISVEADSPPRSIEIQSGDSTFNIILKGLCPNETNIIFDGYVSIEFVGMTGYIEDLSVIGNTPDFQNRTKYILSLKAMCGKFYAVYGTISEE